MDTDVVEFVAISGILTAKKIPAINITSASDLQKGEAQDGFYVELNFPADPVVEFNFDETSQISGALNGASIIDIKRTQDGGDLVVIPISALLGFYHCYSHTSLYFLSCWLEPSIGLLP